MWLFLRRRGFDQVQVRGAVGCGLQFCRSWGTVVSAPLTLHVVSVPFASEHRSTLLCLLRPLALHVLLLGWFGSHSASADRAAAPAVDPFFKKDDRLKSCFAHYWELYFCYSRNCVFYMIRTLFVNVVFILQILKTLWEKILCLMQTNKNDVTWLTLNRACFHALAHLPLPKKACRTRLFSMSQYVPQMSNMPRRWYNVRRPSPQACLTRW